MTRAATFRFYAELNDFLARGRGCEVQVEFVVGPSVKDALEGLGVPHTEVELILANGRPVDFGYRLDDGDRISVYPAFRRLEVTGPRPLRPRLAGEVRFVADAHLGALARYLRLLGFDTAFDPRWSDEDLVERAAGEERVLLTRDRGLLKRRRVVYGVHLAQADPDEQLVEVVRRLRLGAQLRPFTRCMACNGSLEQVGSAEVSGRLEPGTRATYDRFQQCRVCGRVYWEGPHVQRLRGLVAGARAATKDQG